ncbi:MAG: hypothetical protein MI975_21460 [Cytophagales bacterium]|nr:hypothetical protein [Cytophagales bacterium]
MNEKIRFFEERVKSYERMAEALRSEYNAFSLYRIGIFVAFLAFAIWCLNLKLPSPFVISTAIFVITFGLLVKKHNRIKRKRLLYQRLLAINQEEIYRLNHQFTDIDGGEEFMDEKHSYSHDLDIFGRNSLFQLVNRAGTIKGKRLLATWLKKPSGKEEIEKRQGAVHELRPKLEWRQKIQAHGSIKPTIDKEAFFQWLSGDDMIRNRPFFKALPYLVIPISVALIVSYMMELLSLFTLIIPFIISGVFLYKILKYSKTTYVMTQSGVHILESIRNMVILIENENFEGAYLSKIRTRLMPQGIVASDKINKLNKIFDWLSLRNNQIYLFLNSIFLLDFILLAKAEQWRYAYKDEIVKWFDAIAEIEALNSIAAFSFANREYAFPIIEERPFYVRGAGIGHPLIPSAQRKANDFSVDSKGTTCIITGSNMAGKSTFLRTIGINAVLAFAGGPVCADAFRVSIFNIFSSMRTKDNLEENISSFYAELLRLKMLLEEINDEVPTFYLLDEILKGTNSVDRHIGAESLILQLNTSNAFGLVSTHDLELGKLEQNNQKIKNYNFSSSIVGEEIVFDYKLREGICQSTNASQLMANIGIQINS